MNDVTVNDSARMDPEELRDAARRLLSDLVERRAAYDGRLADRAAVLFAAMVEQGWTLLTLKTAEGGLGQSFAALAPIYEEMGRAVAPVFLAPTLAALEIVQEPTSAGLAAAVADGRARCAAAPADGLEVVGQGGSLSVSGVLEGVVADPGVTHLLVLARERVLLIDLSHAGLASQPAELWDRSRTAIDLKLDSVPAILLAQGEAADRACAHLDLALAWDSIGGARQSLEETIAYMGVRQQFGRPIGSFQALKHRAADHKVALELAAALAREATRALAEADAGSRLLAGQARLLANQAYRAVSEDAVQMHGGIGFTWEHDCHLFLKRAWLNDMLLGVAETRRDQLALALFAQMTASSAA